MPWPAAPCYQTTNSDGPLSGIRILDFSNWLPGPFCTQLFSDLGADVIKVEAPAGDPGRGGSGWVFQVSHRNKRSIVADLRNASDRDACVDLAAAADIVVEGFRPGVADRLGIGYQQVAARNPGIIYCSISGFGQTGPDRLRPGHDLSYLASRGGLAYTPHWHAGPPRRSGIPIADVSGAFYAAIAILASLRERDRTTKGAYLDVALADATLAVASLRSGVNFSISEPEKIGVFPNNDIYQTSDGQYVAVSAVEAHFWDRLRAALTVFEPALAEPIFDTDISRHDNGDRLCDLLTAAFRQKSASEWELFFSNKDIPVDRVASVADAVELDQTRARRIVADCEGQRLVVFPVLRNGEILGRFNSIPPALGASTGDIIKV